MRTTKTIAIALIALATSAGTQTAQAQEEEQENYFWITHTNGITEKEVITKRSSIYFSDHEKHEIAQIVVPEHASIHSINMGGCVNLTNLIFRPTTAFQWKSNSFSPDGGYYTPTDKLSITPTPSLRTIAMRPEMIQRTDISGVIWTGREREYSTTFPAWLLMIEWTTNWQVGDPPKMEIRTTQREEVEVVWRTGSLQLADAVSGEWKDYNGSSPYRFPLASAKDMQFFRIKPEEEEEPEEESQ